MTIELFKEYDKTGGVIYYTKLDGEYQQGSARVDLQEAMEVYENIKQNYSKARVETLIKEEI